VSHLVSPLVLSLGGGAFSPFIVNLEPAPGESGAGVADPVRLSIRDIDTYIKLGQLQIVIGYARVRADGSDLYEEDIDEIFLSSTLGGSVDDEKATIQKVAGGVEFTKTLSGPQRSVYFSGSSLIPGNLNAIATAVVRPDSITADAQGAVLGLEHGFRNTAAYLFFTNPSGTPSIRITGPEDANGVRSPDTELTFDWTSTFRRYIIVWNEIKDRVEFYSIEDGITQLLHEEDISNFSTFDDSLLGTPTPRRGNEDDATLVWGIEGPSGDRVTFENVAVATEVGYPIVGLARPGTFKTILRSDETVRFDKGVDPRLFTISPWFGPDSEIFSNVDPEGVAQLLDSGRFQLKKNSANTTFAVYREEPGVMSSENEGFMFEAEFAALPSKVIDGRGTGMGFAIYDGQTLYQLNLFDGAVRTLGVLKTDGFLSVKSIEWGIPVRIRFVVDPRRNKIELFNVDEDLVTPLLSQTFDRVLLPDSSETGLSSEPAFLSFGHLDAIDTAGSFDLLDFKSGTLYQAYEARDGLLPGSADPTWLRVSEGFDEVSPLSGIHLLGGGYGVTPLGYFVAGTGGPIGDQSLVDDQLILDNNPGLFQVFKRSAPWDSTRGAIIEARLQITEFKPHNRTGLFLILDDGLTAYILSFVDTPIGKFVGIAKRAGLSSFVENVGTEGEASDLSFKVDWSVPHTYRLERRYLDGLYIFVDNEEEPSLIIPDSKNIDYPSSQFLAPTIAFGQLSKEGSVSKWDFVRSLFSRGYETSFRRIESVSVLEEKIGNTQTVIVAHAQDND